MIGTTLVLYLATYAALVVAYVGVIYHLAGKGRAGFAPEDPGRVTGSSDRFGRPGGMTCPTYC
jgi:hypothetical protein